MATLLKGLWRRYMTWRNTAPSSAPPADPAPIKKHDIPDDEMGQFQRGLGKGEGRSSGA